MATTDPTSGDPEMPRNFSWVIDDHLCACGLPTKPEHLRFLGDQGVTWIVTLTAEHELPESAAEDFKTVSMKITDFTPPTLGQVLQFVDVMERAGQNDESVAVHCAAGNGRTGTLISCYLVKRFRLTAPQAIQLLRRLRPGAVETEAQADMVSTYEAWLDQLRPAKPADSGHWATPAASSAGGGQRPYEALVSAVAAQGHHDAASRVSQLKPLAAGGWTAPEDSFAKDQASCSTASVSDSLPSASSP